MPNYEYRCTTCSHQWIQARTIDERDADLDCPTCTNPYIVRVFKGNRTAIIFKTDGFYTTDKGKK
jgi:putative FmdB family regulatory protein